MIIFEANGTQHMIYWNMFIILIVCNNAAPKKETVLTYLGEMIVIFRMYSEKSRCPSRGPAYLGSLTLSLSASIFFIEIEAIEVIHLLQSDGL